MKLKNISLEELESMGYDDIAYLVLKESGKKMKIADLFKKVCEVLNLDEQENIDHIADFFGLLSTNKKFVMLKNGYWDLQSKHNTEITIEDNEDESFETEETLESEDEEEKEDDNIFYEDNGDDDVEEDDLSDLVVIDEDEEASS